MKFSLCLFVSIATSLPSFAIADDAAILSKYVGYTIAAVKTVAGYVDKTGERKNDFQGCDFNRQILFDDGTAVTCASYGYQYAYRPTAIILVKSTQISGQQFAEVVMIVESETYDMQGVLLH